ncbi:MAG: glycoside hydrolase, partial [Bacteroidaceae bacterium]|nr:glycoside hydrolase [Bacteroidaceae bacterium]
KIPEQSFESLPRIETLPDPFLFANDKRSTKYKDWEKHRAEIIHYLQKYEIGEKPTVSREQIKAHMNGDTLIVDITVGSETLTLRAAIDYPSGEGPFPAVIGIGFGSGSLPKEIFEKRNIARIAFNFTQVTSHTQKRGQEPINRLYPDKTYIGSYAAWPWGVSRLLDGLEIVGKAARIDMKHIAITGCSFAGKMALFSGALDERIALTIAQEPGGGGVDAWRISETLGHVETIARTNYSWFIEDMRQFSETNVAKLPIDHHQLAALIAPRALLVIGNTDYEWLADESGYVSCKAARTVWEQFGIADRMGFSILGGHPHCQLPKAQYPEVEAFVDRFLLEKSADTNVQKAEMFSNVNHKKWMPWKKD